MSFKLKQSYQVGGGQAAFRGLGKFEDPRLAVTLTNGVFALAVNASYPGDYYTSAPSITIDAAPAAVTALGTFAVAGGLITAASVSTAGFFYTTAPTITVGAVSGASGGAATALLGTNGQVTGVTITNAGTAYTVAPTLTFAAPPSAVNGAATAVLGKGYVVSITLGGTNTNYTAVPTVAISGGGGNGATAIAELDTASQKLTRFTITNPGSNYTGVPTVTVGAVTGANVATGTAIIAAQVTSLTSVSGSGYTSTPAVIVASPQMVVCKASGCFTISEAFGPSPVGNVANTDVLQWAYPTITQESSFDGTQFGKSIVIPNAASGNGIVVFSRTASTKDFQFSAGWIGA